MTDHGGQNEKPETRETKVPEATVASDAQGEPVKKEEPELSGPDHRAHVIRRRDPAPRMSLYNRHDRVYLKVARGLQGPFIVSQVYSDGTYRLETESGKLYRDGANERDLQPL